MSARIDLARVANGREEEDAMSYSMVESLVRERLRAKMGQVYCADCLAKDLQQAPNQIQAAMDELAQRQAFSAEVCPCGGAGLRYRPT